MSAGTSTHQIAQDAVPVIEACEKIPFAMYNKVRVELDRMEKRGIIKKSNSIDRIIN